MMTCNNACRVIAPIRSRCLCVRVAAPSAAQIAAVLQATARKEAVTLPPLLAEKLAAQAHGNLRKALLTLEAARVRRAAARCASAQAPIPPCALRRHAHLRRRRAAACARDAHTAAAQVAQYPFDPKGEVRQADWEAFIDGVAADCVREQSPRKLGEVRNKLYDLLAHCIPPDMIMERLTRALLVKLKHDPPLLQMEVLHHAALYEVRMISGSKAIFHLEAFIAKFMAVYKRHLFTSFGG